MKLRPSTLLIVSLILLSLLVVFFPYRQSAFAVEATLPTPLRANQPPKPRDDTTLYLPLVSSNSTVAQTSAEYPPASPILAGQVTQPHSGSSAVAPPSPDNETFVADTGGWLDLYLKRADVPSGLLTFNIGVHAPVLPATSLDSAGNLTLAGFAALVQNKTLPQYAFLTLQIWDVDHDADGCAEINQLFVNGQPVYDVKSAAPAYLASGNDKWQTWTIGFPASVLKYPTAAGVNGQSPVAVANQIAIEIDTLNCFRWDPWAMEVDWGAISLRPNLNYPLFFVHGWNGSTGTFEEFAGFADQQGILSRAADLDFGIEDMEYSTAKFYSEILKARKELAVNKLNVFAHSRGGLFTRAALRKYLFLAYIIDSYVTFGTPHHGAWAPQGMLSNDINHPWIDQCKPPSNYPNPGEYERKCEVSSDSLTVPSLRIFNYGENCDRTPHIVQNSPFDNGTIVNEWVGCEPQWTLTESGIPAYTIVGGVGDIYATSATLPWVAWANGQYPFPRDWHVDGLFPSLTHISIKDDESVYNYVMALLLSSPAVASAQATQETVLVNQQALQQAQATHSDEEQTLILHSTTIDANSLLSFTVPIQTVTTTLFTIIATNSVTVSLVTPNNVVIDPIAANSNPLITYTVESNGNTSAPQWVYQYQIQNPMDGVWQVQVQALDAARLVLYTGIHSSIALFADADAVTYTPGQIVQVQVGLVDGDILQSGAVITGTLILPDGSSSPVTFYDDGTHGDDAAGNHFYAAQLTAPAINGHPRVVIQATKGNILRLTEVNFIVAAQTATFQQVTNEAVVDTNNNTYADELTLDIVLNVLTAGDYIVSGLLADSNGTTLASATYSTIDTASPLAVGTRTVSLRFDGKALRKAGVNGPYQLKALTIKYYDPAAYESFTVDRDTNVYTTANYSANQFEGELVQVAGSTEAVEDINADGLYDSLKISVTLDLLLPGEYSWFGELVDANGDHVTGASGAGALNSQTPAVFTFGGWQIHNAGRNGPYRLTNVYVTKTTDQVFTEYFDDLHTTAAYQASQFGSLPLLLTNVQHQLVDRNSNGLTDRLVMSATLSAMVLDGAYDWSGRLTDPNGVEIGTTAGTSQLYDGKTLVFAFINTPLIRNSGLNGPFSLRDVTITSRETPTITASFPVVYTTPAYPATQFEAWNFSFTNNSATVSDLDNNGLYDKLTFATTLSVPWAGPYRLDSKLIALQPTERTLITYTRFSTYAGVSSESFTFDGPDLAQDGVDGPYLLRITGVYADDSIPALSLAITQDLTTTLPYSATQFQSFPLLPPPDAPVLAQPLNDDNDGNYLMTWSTIPDATGYELQEHRLSILLPPYATIYTGTVPSFAISGRTGGTYAYRVRTVRGAQVSSWSQSINVTVASATPTPTPTKTTTPTPTPTLSPTPTPVPTLLTDAVLYTSSESGGTVSGIAFADEDILSYNTVTGVWAMVFDGSDVGIGPDLDALHVESDGTLLLSFDAAVTLAGVGVVENEDLVRFTPTTLGDTTAGSFSWVFDGSDVGLDTADEDIDALARTPDGKLVLSTAGAFSVDGVSGVGQDLLVFTASSLGETTSGTWALYFDGSDVGLTNANENLWGAEIAANGDLYLTTFATYAVPGLSGDGDDFFLCSPFTSGDPTACTFHPYWDGDTYGVGSEYLDALAIVPLSNATPTPGATATATVTPVAPTATPTAAPPTNTPTATDAPASTSTPTPTPVPTLLTDAVLYTSSESGGTVSGIAFADEDILSYNTVTGVWAMVFDGSDVGIGPDLDALHVESDGTLLLSFDAAVTLAGVGVVENEDLVRFTPTTLGDTTAGSFSWVFDGSDVGLDTADEDIDALARTPDGKLVLSTAGAFSVDGVSGVGQDLLVFTASSLGETTSGTWALYFDGSDVGLTNANENFWGAEIAANGDLYLKTFATYAVPGLSGDGDDFFLCSPFTSGDPTACTFYLYWDGDTYGVGSEYLDALAISAVPLVGAASADRTTAAPVNPIFLPLIRR